MGITIGAFVGGIIFLLFGLVHAVHAGSFSIILLLSKLQGRPVEPSLFVRFMVAVAIVASIVIWTAVAMLLGGAVGGTVEYLFMR